MELRVTDAYLQDLLTRPRFSSWMRHLWTDGVPRRTPLSTYLWLMRNTSICHYIGRTARSRQDIWARQPINTPYLGDKAFHTCPKLQLAQHLRSSSSLTRNRMRVFTIKMNYNWAFWVSRSYCLGMTLPELSLAWAIWILSSMKRRMLLILTNLVGRLVIQLILEQVAPHGSEIMLGFMIQRILIC